MTHVNTAVKMVILTGNLTNTYRKDQSTQNIIVPVRHQLFNHFQWMIVRLTVWAELESSYKNITTEIFVTDHNQQQTNK